MIFPRDGVLSHRLDEVGIFFTQPEKLLLACWMARNRWSNGLRVLGLKGWLCHQPEANDVSLLSWAARGGDEACLILAGELCVRRGSDPWGGGALHHWAETKSAGSGAGAQILLTLGCSPAERDRWGLLPMHWSRDPVMWSWSLAALWTKGEPHAWLRCALGDYSEAMAILENDGLQTWSNKLGWERIARDRVAQMGVERLAERRQGAHVSREQFAKEWREREESISVLVASQNCIARRLGIELWSERVNGAFV